MTAASVAHLAGRLAVLEEQVRELVTRRRVGDPAADDPFRGLYLTDAAVDHLLAGPRPAADPDVAADLAARVEAAAHAAERAGETVRLRALARSADLTDLDTGLLVVALAGEIDHRFEQLFGYLNDDVSRRRPSVATGFALCGVSLTSASARHRVTHGPLVDLGLVVVEDGDRPLPGRALRVPDRVVAHLLGDDTPDPALADALTDPVPVETGGTARLRAVLDAGVRLVHVRQPAGGAAASSAAAALAHGSPAREVVGLDLRRAGADPVATVRAAVLEATLRGAALVAEPVDAVCDTPGAVEALTGDPGVTVLVGERAWDPAWAGAAPLLVDEPATTTTQRTTLWSVALGLPGSGVDVGAVTAPFRLRPEQVARAARSAVAQAVLRPDGRVTADDVRRGARAENGTGLDRLARRVEPAVGWDDLVLADAPLRTLREVSQRARHRDRVLGEWGMRPGGARGRGVAALFAGGSGTGKTMSAEVVAHDLGLDLYVVDLAAVVDKYVGETEKNLERIFAGAAGVNAVLLFDEADAVFGRRSEVKDAHDRYANIESAYLLQRLETFDGLVILSTNLRANIDEAFTRRLDVVVDFPVPDDAARRLLWDRCLGPAVPRGDDLDLDFCAKAFELAGGAIRSAAVTAAYLAAAGSGVVEMRHLVTAVHREHRKLGRLTQPSEFGPYWELVER
ncbi:ATP-binding protein [Cellulosimicrobium protaetiae]|uniref:ATP-binding protein n=1 Tax=Cellulosimicrobium protaetiae TaxID=2587808 RepID=A0A6M5UBU4_9MICO|nr:ATP-binding protein [Cellulosimicrobium protaetiae]QJW34881.1 ATP-binding protein [Cellulosimicrobium protaetiae]